MTCGTTMTSRWGGRDSAIAAPPERAPRHRRSWASLWLGLVMAGGASPALAGAGEIRTVVTPLSDAVTYSVPARTSPARPALDTYVGYLVQVFNDGGNTINNIRFTGVTSVTDPQERATFSSVEGASCVADGTGTTIECGVGQLRAGASFGPFVVFFKAPAKDAVAPITPDGVAGQCATTDCVGFAGTTFYAEGTGGVPQSTPTNSTAPWAASPVLLGTPSQTQVKSGVQKAGGTFFTGSGAITTLGDTFATLVQVPGRPVYTTLQILESEPQLQACSSAAFVGGLCNESDITVPGSFSPYLTIVLRKDASTILRGTKIDSVTIQYSDPTRPQIGTVVIGLCASATTPRTDGIPCIAERKAYTRRNIPGWTPELDGDFEWTLINLGNGSYRVR